jgi:PPM family protein phosphatase
MADVQGLYLVTAIVLTALLAWVLFVLWRAPKALDESQPTTVRPPRKPEPTPLEGALEGSRASDLLGGGLVSNELAADEPPRVESAGTALSPDPGPSDTPAVEAPAKDSTKEPSGEKSVAEATAEAAVVTAPSGKVAPVRTMLGLPQPISAAMSAESASPPVAPGTPVVVLAPMRSRLDSHPEIQDTSPNATVIVMPDEKGDAKVSPLRVLVSAVGRSEPAHGRLPEKHSIVPRHHLFAFADGAGKKVGPELASAIAVQALTEAFEKDDASAFVDDPKLPARANRVRRAILTANRLLLQRARAAGYAGLGTSGFAAYFSPTNEDLFVAHVGANRAYRLRAGELTRLTTPHGVRFLGVGDKVEVEVVTALAEPGDIYLFCSDGLGRALGDSELLAALTADPSLEAITKRLIDSVKGKDNAEDLVAIAVRVDRAAAPPKKDSGRAKTVMGFG